MISFPASTKIVIVTQPVSFSGGIDKMRGLALSMTTLDPFEHGYFLFISRSKKQIRVLWYDGQGFVLTNKRVSAGKFKNWPNNEKKSHLFAKHFVATSLFFDGLCNEELFHPTWN
jgi:transposase